MAWTEEGKEAVALRFHGLCPYPTAGVRYSQKCFVTCRTKRKSPAFYRVLGLSRVGVLPSNTLTCPGTRLASALP